MQVAVAQPGKGGAQQHLAPLHGACSTSSMVSGWFGAWKTAAFIIPSIALLVDASLGLAERKDRHAARERTRRILRARSWILQHHLRLRYLRDQPALLVGDPRLPDLCASATMQRRRLRNQPRPHR